MKFLLIPAFVSIGLTSFSQSNFASQVEAILKDTINRFNSFQGKFNENPKMGWPYHSAKFDIEGTDDNRVELLGENGYYSARVLNPNKSDSVLTDKLLHVWLEKLTKVLGNKFSLETATHPPGFKAYYMKRYKFSYAHLSILISHERPDPKDRTNNEVRINFEYKPKD
jgi:hypothetical protein